MSVMTSLRTLRTHRGFSLIEISVVLVIVGLIFFLVIRNDNAVSSAKTKALISSVQQLRDASTRFKERYKGLPGDLANASQLITSLTPADNGNGDGLVSAAEANLVASHLASSQIMPSATALLGAAGVAGAYNRIYVVSYAVASSNASPCSGGTGINNTAPAPAVSNVILIEAVPADIARSLDQEFDDGDFSKGKVRADIFHLESTTEVARLC
jgi:prepilin-type N-terminal cleavage/methylation domain-containing protein